MAPSLPNRMDLPTYNDIRGSFNKYRSIAFGTWKVGEARRFSEKPKRRLCSENLTTSTSTFCRPNSFDASCNFGQSQKSQTSLDSKTLVATEDEVSEIEHCRTEPISSINCCVQTTPSLAKRKADLVMTISFDPDCYSSAEYLNCTINKNGFTKNMPLSRAANRSMDALNDRLVHSNLTRSLQRQKPSTSNTNFSFNIPLQQRTRSFDGATHFAVICPGKNAKSNNFGPKSTPQKISAFQATKNFFKKLYTNSTTLPKKICSGKSQQKLDSFKAATSPFYEVRYPEPEEIPYLPYNIQYEIESDNDDNETELDVATDELDSSTAPSCSSSNPDKSLNFKMPIDEGIFSGSEDKSVTGSDFTNQSCGISNCGNTATVQNKFQSWNDLFGHLKKEINDMRARDEQLLESLKTVESQMSYVRGLDRSRSEYSPLEKMLLAPTTIPAGSRPIPSKPRPLSDDPIRITRV